MIKNKTKKSKCLQNKNKSHVTLNFIELTNSLLICIYCNNAFYSKSAFINKSSFFRILLGVFFLSWEICPPSAAVAPRHNGGCATSYLWPHHHMLLATTQQCVSFLHFIDDWRADKRPGLSAFAIIRAVKYDQRAWDAPDEKMESEDVVIIVENEAESKRADEAQGRASTVMMALMDVCPVCKLSFSSREPKLLPCLHSFCKRCLPAHSTPSSSASPARQCKSSPLLQ